MNDPRIQEFGSIVQDLAAALSYREIPAAAFTGEDDPFMMEFVYRPPAKSETKAEVIGAQPRPPVHILTTNAACSLCSGKLFPVRNFFRSGRLPVLFLHYNGAYNSGARTRTDKSHQYIFGGAAEDAIFKKMTGTLGLGPEDFYFQEYPACHFNPVRSLPEEWDERAKNCRIHIAETIKNSNIKHLVICGPSAIFAFGQEKARELAESGQKAQAEFGGHSLPAIVIRSPAALVSLEKKRAENKGRPEDPEYKKILKEEIQIKKATLEALRKILD